MRFLGRLNIQSRSSRGLKTVSVLSYPVNLGQPLIGPDRSPSLLKEHGLLKNLSALGWRVDHVPKLKAPFYSETPVIDLAVNARNCAQVGAVCKSIYDQVLTHSETDNFLLILGGDHSIPIGTLPAIVKNRPNTAVVWVDAHADINTPATSGSGNMHGMPVSFLLGMVEDAHKLPSMEWFPQTPVLQPRYAPHPTLTLHSLVLPSLHHHLNFIHTSSCGYRDIVYIGLRDLDAPEKEAIKRLKIKAYTMSDVDRLGIGRIMEEVDEWLAGKTLHLSFDIDALDPFFAPHTGTAVRGGLTFREGNYICEALFQTGRMRSMELVEVNPSVHSHMDDRTTIDSALALIGSAMGQGIL